MWTVGRESCLFMGGGRAVLLQFAHPYIASGVRQHSNVARDVQVHEISTSNEFEKKILNILLRMTRNGFITPLMQCSK